MALSFEPVRTSPKGPFPLEGRDSGCKFEVAGFKFGTLGFGISDRARCRSRVSTAHSPLATRHCLADPIPTPTLGNRSRRCPTSHIPALVTFKERERFPFCRHVALLLRCGAAALLGLLTAAAQAAPQFPALTGRVVDEAGILSPQAESELTSQLAAHERTTTNQVVVLTLKSLDGYDIADYGYQLGRYWAIGQKDKNNGVVLIVAPTERKVRIEVGYGLEGTLTDALSRDIIERAIRPPFRQGNYEQGIRAGVGAILLALTGEYQPAPPPVTAVGEGGGFGSLAFLFLLAPLLASFGRGRPGKRTTGGARLWTAAVFGGVAGAVVWFIAHIVLVAIAVGVVVFVLALLSRGQLGGPTSGGWGSGGGWSGGGGGWSSGGGGFSGGGGSFGGGGASGDW